MWYGEDATKGTILATSGDPTIAGTGTLWLTNKAAPGDLAGYGLLAPLTSDALLYSIEAITADGSLTLGRNWQGDTASGLTYAIVPINGPTVELLEDIDTLLNSSSYSALNAAVSASAAGDFFQNVGGTITNRTTIQTLLALSNGLSEVNLASATNCNLGAQTSPKVSITGTTTVASLNPSSGTMYPNSLRWVRFTGALTLTNGANLILPGGANIATAAGDTAIFMSDATSTPIWRCMFYQRADGSSVQTLAALKAALLSSGIATTQLSDVVAVATCTLTLKGSSTGSTSYANCRVFKLGNFVRVQFRFIGAIAAMTGNLQIGNLPYTSANVSGNAGGGYFYYFTPSPGAGATQEVWRILGAANSTVMEIVTVGAGSNIDAENVTGSADIAGEISYFT